MAVSIPHGVVKSDRLLLDRLREDCYYEALAFSRYSINLELDEDILKPERRLPRHQARTMKMKQWCQGQDRFSDESQWQLPSNRER